jgi:hypothetical protein
MALTADQPYKTTGPTEITEILAGAADTLYQGAIVSIGADGFIKVPGDVASEVPLGMCVAQVIAAGANAETVKIETGRLLCFKRTQHVVRIHCEDDDAAGNAKYDGAYFIIYDGKTGYGVWFGIGATAVPAAIAAAGLTAVKVTITALLHDAQIAALIETALEAVGAGGGAVFDVSTATHVCTVTVQRRSYTKLASGATAETNVALEVTNTRLSGAQQADIGLLFKAKVDDGVVYAAEAATADIYLGECVGTEGEDYLWIDTRRKAH